MSHEVRTESRPFIESMSAQLPTYAVYKSRYDLDCSAAHRQRRHDVLVAAAKSAATLDQLRQVVPEHIDPQVLRIPAG